MLVFTRKLDEAIVIGDGIEVKVLRIGKDGVRLGVTAAPHVPVHRREIYDQIRAANAAAAAARGGVEDLVARLRGRVAPIADRS
ncbi:MAG TPA: carbon storage regulator CsrA [Vicinamibacterales bacterium]|nr:carbon storage regulator CsrA [Vicinamibacterales bacterium]